MLVPAPACILSSCAICDDCSHLLTRLFLTGQNARGGKRFMYVTAFVGGKQSTLHDFQLGWNAGWRSGGHTANEAYRRSRYNGPIGRDVEKDGQPLSKFVSSMILGGVHYDSCSVPASQHSCFVSARAGASVGAGARPRPGAEERPRAEASLA